MAETKSGLREVHVQLFPRIGEARAGLIDGSNQPRRRSDGKQLFRLARTESS
jgi:hypothetical protein